MFSESYHLQLSEFDFQSVFVQIVCLAKCTWHRLKICEVIHNYCALLGSTNKLYKILWNCALVHNTCLDVARCSVDHMINTTWQRLLRWIEQWFPVVLAPKDCVIRLERKNDFQGYFRNLRKPGRKVTLPNWPLGPADKWQSCGANFDQGNSGGRVALEARPNFTKKQSALPSPGSPAYKVLG